MDFFSLCIYLIYLYSSFSVIHLREHEECSWFLSVLHSKLNYCSIICLQKVSLSIWPIPFIFLGNSMFDLFFSWQQGRHRVRVCKLFGKFHFFRPTPRQEKTKMQSDVCRSWQSVSQNISYSAMEGTPLTSKCQASSTKYKHNLCLMKTVQRKENRKNLSSWETNCTPLILQIK
jgi:hypothetical protein